MRKFCGLLLATCLIGVLTCAARAEAAGMKYAELTRGQLADLVQAEGQGKVVVVTVFAYWCGPCREEMPILTKLRSEIGEQDLLILGVSADDDVMKLNEFILKYRIIFPVRMASDDFMRGFRINAIPHTLMYDRQGKLAQNFSGLIAETDYRKRLQALLDKK